MTDEEYENSPQELKLIYINYGLEERRKKHLSKHGYVYFIVKTYQLRTLVLMIFCLCLF